MDSSIHTYSDALAALVQKIGPAVFAVHGRRHTTSSGVHWRNGYIVTAEHTLRRDEDIAVTGSAGEEAKAQLVGRDPGTDLALLHLENLNTPPAPVGSSDGLRPGDLSLVIGRSPNSGPNASMGIISAVSGPWRTWRGGQLDQYLRLDATVFSGSSGGAVVNERGEVIGIATSALSRVAGLAVPASTVNRVVDLLLEHGSIPRGYLGVGLQPVAIPEALRTKLNVRQQQGALVLNTEEGSPADRAGILVGDILLEIGGTAVEEAEDLQALLGPDNVGKRVPVKIIRGGEIAELTVTVGVRLRRKSS